MQNMLLCVIAFEFVKQEILKGDSLLVIKEIQGICKCQSDGLHTFYKEALALIKCFHKVQVKHVSSLDNKEANALAQNQLKILKLVTICVLEDCKDVTSLIMEVCEFLNGVDLPKGLNPILRK